MLIPTQRLLLSNKILIYHCHSNKVSLFSYNILFDIKYKTSLASVFKQVEQGRQSIWE